MWRILIGIGSGLVAAWLALAVVLILARPKVSGVREVARLVPDTVRLLRRMAADRSLPRGVRVRLWLLLGYVVLPVDLVPDFLPVIGHVDDVIIVGLVLRSVVRRSGTEAVRGHWPGSADGLAALCRIAGIPNDARSS